MPPQKIFIKKNLSLQTGCLECLLLTADENYYYSFLLQTCAIKFKPDTSNMPKMFCFSTLTYKSCSSMNIYNPTKTKQQQIGKKITVENWLAFTRN